MLLHRVDKKMHLRKKCYFRMRYRIGRTIQICVLGQLLKSLAGNLRGPHFWEAFEFAEKPLKGRSLESAHVHVHVHFMMPALLVFKALLTFLQVPSGSGTETSPNMLVTFIKLALKLYAMVI